MDYICPSLFVVSFGLWSTICFAAGHLVGRLTEKYKPKEPTT